MLELFNLDVLTKLCNDDADLTELAKRVRSAVSAVSVRSDLKRAAEMMAACAALSRRARATLPTASVSREEAATIQALFSQALIIYCRATHSGGKGRNKLQITNFLEPELRTLHDRVTNLRDHYLAHYEESSGWEKHHAVLALDIDERMMALSYPQARAYIRQEDATEFEELLGRACIIADEQQAKMSARLNAELNELFERRPDFLTMLRSTPFAPESFFDPDEVAAYLAAIGRREADPHTEPRIGLIQKRVGAEERKG